MPPFYRLVPAPRKRRKLCKPKKRKKCKKPCKPKIIQIDFQALQALGALQALERGIQVDSNAKIVWHLNHLDFNKIPMKSPFFRL